MGLLSMARDGSGDIVNGIEEMEWCEMCLFADQFSGLKAVWLGRRLLKRGRSIYVTGNVNTKRFNSVRFQKQILIFILV